MDFHAFRSYSKKRKEEESRHSEDDVALIARSGERSLSSSHFCSLEM